MNKLIMKRALSEQSGFTLLELLIATVILAIGLLGVAGMQLVAINGNYFGKELTVANTLIAGKIEALKGIPYDQVDAKNGTEYFVWDGKKGNKVTTEPSSGFYYTVETVVPGTGITGVDRTKNVEVRVSWIDSNGKKRTHKSSTVVFDNGNDA